MAKQDSSVRAPSPLPERSGTRVLELLANPLNLRLLRAHTGGRQRLPQLQEQIGWPPQSTLRVAIRNLRDIGVIEKHVLPGAPYTVENEITPAGRDLLAVAAILETWLSHAPAGPLEPESNAAKAAVKALAAGWSSHILSMLAAHPSTLSDLDRSIPEATYPSLERRLTRMRVTSQIEPVAGEGRGTPFVATEWLRRSVAPLAAAMRWEHRHLEGGPGVAGNEIETLLLLGAALPLPLPPSVEGEAFLGVPDAAGTGEGTPFGAMVAVEGGKVVSAMPGDDSSPGTWALGTPENWLAALLDGDLESIRFGGTDPQLARNIAEGIHFALFRDQVIPNNG